MTIHLPENLESSILAAVHSGRYATLRSTTRWLKPHPCSSNA